MSAGVLPCSIWGVIFSLQGAAAVYAAMEAGYQMPGKCAAVNAVGELCWPQVQGPSDT